MGEMALYTPASPARLMWWRRRRVPPTGSAWSASPAWSERPPRWSSSSSFVVKLLTQRLTSATEEIRALL
jgi:hypothetical protein